MLGGEVVEGQQFLAVLDQAYSGLGVFCLESLGEQIECLVRICARLGLPYVVQHLLRLGLGALREIIQNVPRLMHPAALLVGCGENFLQSRPEPHGPVTGRQFWGAKTTAFQGQKHLAPTLRAFANTVFDGQKMFLSSCVNPNDDKDTKPVIRSAEPAVNSVGPE